MHKCILVLNSMPMVHIYSRYGSSGSFAPPLQSDLAGRCSLLTKLFVYVFSVAVCHYLIPIVSYSGLRWTK